MKKFYSTLLITFLIIGCSKDDTINEIEEEEEEEVVNLPPNNFDIEIVNISHNSATINWNEAVDPENENVSYDIYLNQTLVAENISEFSYYFDKLEELTEYTGKIVAQDINNNHTEVIFSFKTIKYYLKYLTRYDYGTFNYGPNGYAYGDVKKMIKTSDNNYVLYGESSNPNGNATRLLILKIDYDGNLIWRKFYDFEPSHIGYGSIIEHSNGFVFTGENTIIKINKDGDIIWHKLNKDFIKDNTSITSLNVDSENNIYIIGKRSSEEPQKGREGVISKINSFGELIWERMFKISLFDNFYDLTINSNDEIFILGTTETKGATWEDHIQGDSSLKEIDFLVVKITTKGKILWYKAYGDGRHDFAKQVLIKSNNNIVFAGYSWGAYDISQGRIFEINQDGNEVWNVSTELSSTTSIAETLDGGFITTGHVDFGDFGALGIYKFSSIGVEEWNKKYQESFSYLYGRSVLAEEDGGYRIAGSFSKNYYYGEEKPELLVYKTDSEGNYE